MGESGCSINGMGQLVGRGSLLEVEDHSVFIGRLLKVKMMVFSTGATYLFSVISGLFASIA